MVRGQQSRRDASRFAAVDRLTESRFFQWTGGLMLAGLLFITPHLLYFCCNTPRAPIPPAVLQRMGRSADHPLIREALESHVKRRSPAVYHYLSAHNVPIVFTDLPAGLDSQRVVTWCSAHIEISREYCATAAAQRDRCLAKIAQCLIHEGTHCQRLEAGSLVAMIYQSHRYILGMQLEEAVAYDAEGVLGFGTVHVRPADVAAERQDLLEGLLARDASGVLLIILFALLARQPPRLRESEPDWPVIRLIRERMRLMAAGPPPAGKIAGQFTPLK